ncbi:hypothetical protein ACA910_000978 [Epithemia clementina (nom. ined.)]
MVKYLNLDAPYVAVILFVASAARAFKLSPTTTTTIRRQCRDLQQTQFMKAFAKRLPQSHYEVNKDMQWALFSSSTVTSNIEPSLSNATQSVAVSGFRSSSSRTINDMPWGEVQEWALRDKLKYFTVAAPIATQETGNFQSFILWRSLVEDTPELAGYPISFIIKRFLEIRSIGDGNGISELSASASHKVLPYLDDFEFESNGGMSGRVYGMAGVAEGTRIETAPVGNIEVTLPKSFVQTEDGATIYEIGKPAAEFAETASQAMKALNGRRRRQSKQAYSIVQDARGDRTDFHDDRNDSFLDPELLNLAGATAVVAIGAYALETLSHHLTVNVFWV